MLEDRSAILPTPEMGRKKLVFGISDPPVKWWAGTGWRVILESFDRISISWL